MARISAEQAGGENVLAFLDMIAWSEGTSVVPDSDDGYRVIVGSTIANPKLFKDYADHPRIYVRSVNSTAAGRYQLLARYYDAYKTSLHLKDFSPVSQDLIALQQIRERKALPLIAQGKIEQAVAQCANIWASFTGSPYGQHTHKITDLIAAYEVNGGLLTTA